MDLKTFISKMRVFGDNVRKSSQKALYRNESFILRELRAHSPKDSGTFAKNWRAKRLRFSGEKTLAGLVISNKTVGYGQFAAQGADPGQAPWYFPHAKTKPTGKLTVVNGKVWAGGLEPGHAKTVGGAISRIISDKDLLNKLSIEISNESVKALL